MLLYPSAIEIFYLYLSALVSFFLAAIIFIIITKNKNLSCNHQFDWWHSGYLKVDLSYLFFTPCFKVLLRYIPAVIIYAFLLLFNTPEQIYDNLRNGVGPLASYPFILQIFSYIIISDFFHYWNHRLFHSPILWPIHAVHHSPRQVDWTTAYRFHPLNLALGPWLIPPIIIFLGVSPLNVIYIAPVEAVMAYFVHANLNITLGPLRYIIATPVFHRWHHTFQSDGGGKNYGGTFAFWDVLFGTFYFPENQLPERYGINDEEIEEDYLIHLFYPFITWHKYIYKYFRHR